MKKRIDINGDALRQQREQRALTQEELSENRGLESARCVAWRLDALRRVSEALAAEPRVLFEPTAQDCHQQVREALLFDRRQVPPRRARPGARAPACGACSAGAAVRLSLVHLSSRDGLQ